MGKTTKVLPEEKVFFAAWAQGSPQKYRKIAEYYEIKQGEYQETLPVACQELI